MKKLILCAIIGMMALAAAAQTVQHGLVLEYRRPRAWISRFSAVRRS